MLESYTEYAAALSDTLHETILRHLIRKDGQEDLCFAIYYPSKGMTRLTAIINEIILPKEGDRIVEGNVSFTPQYFTRALSEASMRGGGLVLLHSHLGPGWQGMSPDDIAAEAGHAGAVSAATGLPFLGLTAGTDGSWSGRFWQRVAPKHYEPHWCTSVRVVGHRLGMTYHPELRPAVEAGAELERTVGVWGQKGQAQLARLRVGIVGLGSVGSVVGEALARMGIERLSFIDYDLIETRNLDRVLGATRADIGERKVDVAARNAVKSATAHEIQISRVPESIVEAAGYRAALDCDVLFSCVDRPWARRVLNHIAYAHLIPIIDGGILVRIRGERLLGADWHVHTVAPGRRCLECLQAYDAAMVGLEQGGALDNPSYLAQLDPGHVALRHENVFPFSLNVASLEVLQMTALVVGPVNNLGDQNYHYATGSLDKTTDQGCDAACLYPLLTATADSRATPTGLDHGAEKFRAFEYIHAT